MRRLDLVLADQVDRSFRNEDEEEKEGNVQTGEDDGQPLPVEKRAEDVTRDHAKRAGDGRNDGQTSSHVRRRDLHDVDRRHGRRKPESGSVKKPPEEQHPEPLSSGDEGVARGEAAAGAEDAGPLPADQVGHRAGDQAAHQHAKCGYAHWKQLQVDFN